MAFKKTVSYVDLKSTVTFTNLQSLLQYVDLSAVNVFLDADSKNLYFLSGHPNAEVITLSEALAVTFTTTKEETLTITEQLVQSFSKPVADAMTMSEAAVLLVSIPTSDALSMSDASPVLATGLNKEDSFAVSEILIKSFTAEKSDAVSLTEAPVLTPGLSKTDTISMSESFSRVVSYLRSFTDGFTLDDLASVDDPLQTDVGLDKTNITTLSEEHIYSLSKGLTDSFAITENAELLLSKE